MAVSPMLSPGHDDASTTRESNPSVLHLAETNINPLTGLATDYLNHFNEAIMLLEMLVEMPDCREDFFSWKPITYSQHFAASKFKDRDIAIAAYEAAEPARRKRLETLAEAMNEIVMATHGVMRLDLRTPVAANIAHLAVRWLHPLVARAGAVINGTDTGNSDGRQRPIMPQAEVDALMAR
jgi:hypothetical protein